MSRRGFALTASAVLPAMLARCQTRSEASPAPSGSARPALGSSAATQSSNARTRLLEWTFDGAPSTRTAVLVPTHGAPDARFPVLIALHGRGEARKSPAEGALGWPRDYALSRAIDRVSAPPLGPVDFEGNVDAIRLAYLNRRLTERPFGGLIVACPYVPDLDLADDEGISAFGRFLTTVLLPRLRHETPALPSATATGIDGVSLGGALSLAIGLDSASSFGAVGTLQPAIDAHDAPRWTARAEAARRANPALAIRLLTSDGDYFREAVRTTSSAFAAAGVVHDFDVVVGPHDYPFNRGPGAIEMLTWQDRALSRHA